MLIGFHRFLVFYITPISLLVLEQIMPDIPVLKKRYTPPPLNNQRSIYTL